MHERVFWRGRHTVLGWSSPVGKLHREGIEVLRHAGFYEVSRDADVSVPALFWNTRKAADFPSTGADLPLVRLLPQSHTAALDDKIRCAEAMERAGCMRDGWMPQTLWRAADLAALEAKLQQHREDGPADTTDSPASPASALWFAKHRHGVKGQAVLPVRGSTLETWLSRRSTEDYVLQAEVAPPALYEGRKFVLRLHALVACRGQAPPAAWVHRDVIVLGHSTQYSERADDKAAHVSQAGRHHPPPCTLDELPADHPAASPTLPLRLCELVRRSLQAVASQLIPELRCSVSTLYSLLGYDVTLDANGQPQLLEVNDYPAIASGTMSSVPKEVYTRMVSDVLALLVLPALESTVAPPAAAGGFVRLPDTWQGHQQHCPRPVSD